MSWSLGEFTASQASGRLPLPPTVRQANRVFLCFRSTATVPRIIIEGQLNPHMWALLQDKAKTLDLAGKPCACIGLGDHRYFYTARAADHLQQYVTAHHGRLIVPALKIIDEPYGQEEAVRVWGKQLVDASKQIDWS
jgi:hypothetical protein